jgi:hypothetical protein
VETQLEVPYRDTASGDLVWRLGEPRCPALATLEVPWPGGRVELRLLGSSHQVIFVGGRTVISEVVACARPRPAAAEAGLPAEAERDLDGWAYRFRSFTHELAPHRFGPWVDRLAGSLAAHPAAMVGRFPGSPHAITALLAGPGPGDAGVRWRTWHAYPQDRCLVATSTTVRPR